MLTKIAPLELVTFKGGARPVSKDIADTQNVHAQAEQQPTYAQNALRTVSTWCCLRGLHQLRPFHVKATLQ